MKDCHTTPYTPRESVYQRKESPYSQKKYCPPVDVYLLAEDGTFLLLENGYKILL